MQLETVTIRGFRSIKFATLLDCGGFNVLIGKNNSGKSNILLAIYLFFQAIRGKEPVIVDPVLTRAFDHHKRQTNEPLNVSLDFQLSLAERDSLIQNIVSDAPHVKNAVAGMDPDLRLGVTVAFVSAPTAFAYVSELVLHKQKLDEKSQPDSSARRILTVDERAGTELANRAMVTRRKAQEVTFLDEYLRRIDVFDTDDWERTITDPDRALRMLDVMRGRVGVTASELRNKIMQVLHASQTKASFKEALDALKNSILQEAQSLPPQPLENRIESISGKEPSIPQYALTLIGKVGEMKVLFLKERREPIGASEAGQLLELKVTRGGPEKLREIQQTVAALLGVEIDAFQSAEGGKAAELDVDQFGASEWSGNSRSFASRFGLRIPGVANSPSRRT